MDKLRDIKTIVDVSDYSLWVLVAVVLMFTIILSYIIFKFLTRRKKRVKPTLKQTALKKLKNINFTDEKSAIYTFSENFALFLDEDNEAEFSELQNRLVEYKYKKSVESLPEDIKRQIKSLIKELR